MKAGLNYKIIILLMLCPALLGITGCKKNKSTPPKGDPQQAEVVVANLSAVKGGGGTTVTITGSGFGANIKDNKVTFNGVEAVVTAASASSLTVAVPFKAGTGPVKVQVGSKTGIGPNFEYEFVYRVSTLAGSPTQFGYKDGTGSAARFSDQFIGLKLFTDGNLYLTERGNQRIRKITPAGAVSTFAGSGATGFKEGSLLTAQFNGTFDLVAGQEDVIYVTDGGNYRIRKISGGTVSTFAGSVAGSADGQGVDAQFDFPVYLAIDLNGNLYVTDYNNYSIRKITPAGLVSTFVGGNKGYQDGVGNAAKMDRIGGLVVDSKGNLYIADGYNQCIRKVTPDGTVTTFAGVKGESVPVDGQLSAARFFGPAYLAIDASDNIYVVDYLKIRKISADGIVSTVAGTGKEGANDGPVATAQFTSIGGLAVTPDGKTLYVGDFGLGTIREISLQ